MGNSKDSSDQFRGYFFALHAAAVISRSANRRPQINFIGLISLISLILAPTTATKHIAAVIKLYGALTGVFVIGAPIVLPVLPVLHVLLAPTTAAMHITAGIRHEVALHTAGVFSASRRTNSPTGPTRPTGPPAPTTVAMHISAGIRHEVALHTTGVFSASRRTYRLTGLTGLTRPTAPTAAEMHTSAVIQHCAALPASGGQRPAR